MNQTTAPVPFLVGITSNYLREVPAEHRPLGIVFVDLDNDLIHLGLDEVCHCCSGSHLALRVVEQCCAKFDRLIKPRSRHADVFSLTSILLRLRYYSYRYCYQKCN
jgi:predicted methyltransferase